MTSRYPLKILQLFFQLTHEDVSHVHTHVRFLHDSWLLLTRSSGNGVLSFGRIVNIRFFSDFVRITISASGTFIPEAIMVWAVFLSIKQSSTASLPVWKQKETRRVWYSCHKACIRRIYTNSTRIVIEFLTRSDAASLFPRSQNQRQTGCHLFLWNYALLGVLVVAISSALSRG